MRIIVMSDSHGASAQLEKIISANKDADIFIHLGDGETEIQSIRLKYPDIDLRSVHGNCDFGMGTPLTLVVEAEGHRIFCTHGHRYGVKDGTEMLRSIAMDNDCDAVLFGHTHERYISCEDGIDIMNPGSCRLPRDGNKPSYGYIDITENGLFMNVTDVGV
ncbi:MAG: metallophosphoesterase [Oscillospiraceae bacterium]|nr:metallophosphoesterase [Oscillospiraceae bacterium]